jgi:hypothetical protein
VISKKRMRLALVFALLYNWYVLTSQIQGKQTEDGQVFAKFIAH